MMKYTITTYLMTQNSLCRNVGKILNYVLVQYLWRSSNAIVRQMKENNNNWFFSDFGRGFVADEMLGIPVI